MYHLLENTFSTKNIDDKWADIKNKGVKA